MNITVRLDDITPDMDWERFYKFKALLDQYQVKPLIGVEAGRYSLRNRSDNRPLCKRRGKRSRLFDEQAGCCTENTVQSFRYFR